MEILIDPLVKPRLIVLSDIGNEPDDQQSLVRLLTYANEFDIEGLIPTTSMWQRNKIRPDLMETVIKAYGEGPRENLMIHTGEEFPTADKLLSIIKLGELVYGMFGVGKDHDSEGSEWIISVVDKPDPRPIWIAIWGGSNCLAQSLWKVKKTRDKNSFREFINKIRVYAIFDQDDSGPWIRKTFPKLYYVVSPFPDVPDTTKDDYHLYDQSNLDSFNQDRFKTFLGKNIEYCQKATWPGISGDKLYQFKGGPYSFIITNKWLNENIRKNHGPLGKVYPRVKFAMEGDTPSFLNLVNNGLRSSQSPTYGGWGGRYKLYKPKGEPRPIYTDVEDTVIVGDKIGEIKGNIPGVYTSNHATIWRWREAYQNDFAARMDWTVTPNYKDANHPPKVIIQGELDKKVKGNENVILDSTGTFDPDEDQLFFYWFHYKEVGTYTGEVNIQDPNAIKTTLSFKDQEQSGTIHIILQVKDNGVPSLYRYARIILDVK